MESAPMCRRACVCSCLHVALFQRVCKGSGVPRCLVKTGLRDCWEPPSTQWV